MALVVFLRGVNVGGHRSFRPSVLAARLKHLGAVSIGTAGTFVIRRRVGRTPLRAAFTRSLAFEAEVVICDGRDVVRLASRDYFSGHPDRADLVRFVSVLSRSPRAKPSTPLSLPTSGSWMVRVLGREGRFVVGVYRRQMKVIGHLGALDRVFGVPVTTRSWKTIAAVAAVLEGRGT